MIEILAQTDDYIAVNKPADMLVHRTWLSCGETVFLLQTLRDQLGRHVFPVHRLDRPTSGIMLFALHREAAQYFTGQFGSRLVRKTYLAIARGWTDDAGCIDYPLKEQLDKIADRYADGDKPAQAACTEYRTLARSELPIVSTPRYPTSR